MQRATGPRLLHDRPRPAELEPMTSQWLVERVNHYTIVSPDGNLQRHRAVSPAMARLPYFLWTVFRRHMYTNQSTPTLSQRLQRLPVQARRVCTNGAEWFSRSPFHVWKLSYPRTSVRLVAALHVYGNWRIPAVEMSGVDAGPAGWNQFLRACYADNWKFIFLPWRRRKRPQGGGGYDFL